MRFVLAKASFFLEDDVLRAFGASLMPILCAICIPREGLEGHIVLDRLRHRQARLIVNLCVTCIPREGLYPADRRACSVYRTHPTKKSGRKLNRGSQPRGGKGISLEVRTVGVLGSRHDGAESKRKVDLKRIQGRFERNCHEANAMPHPCRDLF